MKHTLKRILRYIGRYKFLLALSVFLAAATVALSLYLPTAFGEAIDNIVGIDNVTGSIEIGKRADISILDKKLNLIRNV